MKKNLQQKNGIIIGSVIMTFFLFILILFSCTKELSTELTGTDQDVHQIVIKPTIPTADFSADKTNILTGDSVVFTDKSTGKPSLWSWDFGDGYTSNVKNPHHIFASSGVFSVTLICSNKDGCDTLLKPSYITVSNQASGIPMVTTKQMSNITQTDAYTGGNVTSDGGNTVTVRGVCWDVASTPTISKNHTSDGTGLGDFSSHLTGLANGTKYYVRAYATNSKGTGYGNEVIFITGQNMTTPSVSTSSAVNIGNSSARLGGNVTSDGGSSVTERGVCWKTSSNPSISDNHSSNGQGTGVYTIDVTGLIPNTPYYVKAYAINSIGIAYGNEITFTTVALNPPTVTTTQVTNLTQTSASSGGNVTSDGGAAVTGRGVCWSTSQNPTTASTHSSDGSGTGQFTSNLTGLTPNTPYYVRAYAVNSQGTSYGQQLSFTTTQSTSIPTVTTNSVTNIQKTSATSGGNVTSDGGASVTARGVCWNTSQYPTTNNSHTSDGSGTGQFTSNLSGLTPGTPYYVRAFATNSNGTAYGSQQTFTTLSSTQTVEYIYDDGSAEYSWYISLGGGSWLGNYFPLGSSVTGNLTSFKAYFVSGSSSSFTARIDVYNSYQTLIGSTGTFTTPADSWVTVPVNNLSFSGPFYAMVYWIPTTPDPTYALGEDTNGPNVSDDLAYYYDGSSFQKVSSFSPYIPGVFLLRATAVINTAESAKTIIELGSQTTKSQTSRISRKNNLSRGPSQHYK